MEKYLEKVIENAKEAFYQSVLKDLPLIDSGDIHPMIVNSFEDSCEEIVKDVIKNV